MNFSNKTREVKPAIKPFNPNDRVSPVRKVQLTNGIAENQVPNVRRTFPAVVSSRSPVRMSVKENKNESINQKMP